MEGAVIITAESNTQSPDMNLGAFFILLFWVGWGMLDSCYKYGVQPYFLNALLLWNTHYHFLQENLFVLKRLAFEPNFWTQQSEKNLLASCIANFLQKQKIF